MKFESLAVFWLNKPFSLDKVTRLNNVHMLPAYSLEKLFYFFPSLTFIFGFSQIQMNLYLNKQNFLSYDELKIHEIQPLYFLFNTQSFPKTIT